MTDGRPLGRQLVTGYMILSHFEQQIREHDEQGLHTDRIEALREGHTKWITRVADLEARLKAELDAQDLDTRPDQTLHMQEKGITQ